MIDGAGFNEAFQDQVCLELAKMDKLSEKEVDEVLMSITEDEVRAATQSLPAVAKSCWTRSNPARASAIWW